MKILFCTSYRLPKFRLGNLSARFFFKFLSFPNNEKCRSVKFTGLTIRKLQKVKKKCGTLVETLVEINITNKIIYHLKMFQPNYWKKIRVGNWMKKVLIQLNFRGGYDPSTQDTNITTSFGTSEPARHDVQSSTPATSSVNPGGCQLTTNIW